MKVEIRPIWKERAYLDNEFYLPCLIIDKTCIDITLFTIIIRNRYIFAIELSYWKEDKEIILRLGFIEIIIRLSNDDHQ